MKSDMKIGYIVEYDWRATPHLDKRFKFCEASFTRSINSRGDMIHSKILMTPVEYEEIVGNARAMKENPALILVKEPFLLDDGLREKIVKWVEWANKADPKEFDPFA